MEIPFQGVIDIATGELLRAGFVDFENAPDFDPENEEVRFDIDPDMGCKGSGTDPDFKKWDGQDWVTQERGAKPDLFKATSKMASAPVVISETSNWENLEGVVTSIGAFVKKADKAQGRMVGQVKTDGAGAEIDVAQGDEGAEVSIMSAPFTVPDTGGQWQKFSFSTDLSPNLGLEVFRPRARKNTVANMEVRFTSLSLLEKGS